MKKTFYLFLLLIGMVSCQKTVNNYERYLSQLEIDGKLMNQSRDVSFAKHELFGAQNKLESATFFKPGDSFYSQREVDNAKKNLKEAQEGYVTALETYAEALSEIVNTLAEEPTDTVEYKDEIAVTTYCISENDYNYYQAKLKKIRKDIERYSK